MPISFDHLQIIFWSITYLLIVICSLKYRKDKENSTLYMPLLPCCLNFAWEINACVISRGFWGHLLWCGLDIFIFILNFRNVATREGKVLYGAGTAIIGIFFLLLFRVPGFDGMLSSSFVMDFLMSIAFVVQAKKISPHGKIWIALFKLIGDAFAWLAYNDHTYVMVIGIAVLLINFFYLGFCLEEKSRHAFPDRKAHRKHK